MVVNIRDNFVDISVDISFVMKVGNILVCFVNDYIGFV